MILETYEGPLGKRKQKLLKSLSNYEHEAAFKQVRKKRHKGTGEWLFQTAEFEKWNNDTRSSVFWCSGKRKDNNVSSWAALF